MSMDPSLDDDADGIHDADTQAPPPYPFSMTPMRVFKGRHTAHITSVAWSPNGRSLATSSDDGTVRVTTLGLAADDDDMERVIRVGDRRHGVTCVAWSPDGTYLATANESKGVRVWKNADLALERFLGRRGEHITSLAWSPDGMSIALGMGMSMGDSGAETRVVSSTTGHVKHIFHRDGDVGDHVTSVAWSPDGKYVVTLQSDRVTRYWDVETGVSSIRARHDGGRSTSMALSHDGTRLATASPYGGVEIWDMIRVRLVHHLCGHVGGGVWSVAWSPDGKSLATGSDDGTARIWSAETGQLQRSFVCVADQRVVCSWSPDGTRLATGSADGTTRVWFIAESPDAARLVWNRFVEIRAVRHELAERRRDQAACMAEYTEMMRAQAAALHVEDDELRIVGSRETILSLQLHGRRIPVLETRLAELLAE